jgi:hypothetical protein
MGLGWRDAVRGGSNDDFLDGFPSATREQMNTLLAAKTGWIP